MSATTPASRPEHHCREVTASDLPDLEAVIAATGLFPPQLLAGMLAPAGDGALWLTNADGPACCVGYCVPERMTEGTWNILLMATHPAAQGAGRGGALVRAIEQRLHALAARIVLVETSGAPGFARTRSFYRGCGFQEEARIRDFYQAGEDKLVFRKALARG